MNLMYNVGVVGAEAVAAGFRAIGFRAAIATDAATARKEVRRLIDENCAIIYITEDLYILAPDIAEKSRETALPAIIVIPGSDGGKGVGLNELRATALKATGMDVLSIKQ